jgi:hypothetical protein
MSELYPYAVAIADDVESMILFFWAEDPDHAEEQARDAYAPLKAGDTCDSYIVAVASVPEDYVTQSPADRPVVITPETR